MNHNYVSTSLSFSNHIGHNKPNTTQQIFTIDTRWNSTHWADAMNTKMNCCCDRSIFIDIDHPFVTPIFTVKQNWHHKTCLFYPLHNALPVLITDSKDNNDEDAPTNNI